MSKILNASSKLKSSLNVIYRFISSISFNKSICFNKNLKNS